MSKRNTRAAKARRRAERISRHRQGLARARAELADLVGVQSLDELTALAERGQHLPCGCDAHELLHDMLGVSAR